MAERLERHGSGYRLTLEPGELDVDAGRRVAVDDPGAALALWRGPALEEFDWLPALEAESVGLDELRLRLVDDDLDHRLGRGEDVTVEAAAAAAASPLRERTTLLHLRALAAEGRTAEAMEAARAFRRRLAEETGLEPTAALAELEHLVAAGSVERPSSVVRRVARPGGPLVGRQHERQEVVCLLGRQALVTVTGPGGVGKTTLALDVAADADEAVFVPLAVVDRPERVCQAVASTLGLRTSGLHDVLTRLDRALDLATGLEGPDAARQRTLRATIASSYRLLTADEQWLLRAISPFVGGVDVTTFEDLAAELLDDPVDLLHGLVDASLLVADAESGRYRQLFTVRAFLLEETQRLGEAAETTARFVSRCRVVAEEIGTRMFGPGEAVVDRRLRDELDNLRAARDHAAFDDRWRSRSM